MHMHNHLMFSLDFKFNDLTSYNGYQLFYDNSSRTKKRPLVAFYFDAIFLYQDAHESGQGCRLCSLCHLGRSVLPHLNCKCIQTKRFANLIKALSLSFILRPNQLNVR